MNIATRAAIDRLDSRLKRIGSKLTVVLWVSVISAAIAVAMLIKHW
jgi:hypothetical protein